MWHQTSALREFQIFVQEFTVVCSSPIQEDEFSSSIRFFPAWFGDLFFPFFSFRLICFSKQLSNSPSFSSFIRMSCFKVVHRHLSSIFSRGLGDKCTPGASAKSQKRGDVGEVVLQKEVGDPPLSSKKIHPRMINIAPEKWWLEDYFPIGKVTFQGL